LSSGLRVNNAADDAAGLAISEKMRAQIRGLDQASRNAQDGISMIQTAEGGMVEIGNMTQRIRELTVQASNDSNVTTDRIKIQQEIVQLLEEIDKMSTKVEFNTRKLINGDYSTASTGQKLTLQVGANKNQVIQFNIGNMNSQSLGISGFSVSGKRGSTISAMISQIDTAVQRVADERAKLGAIQNRLEYSIKSLDVSSENLSASESRIRDADMAREMMNLTKANVLQQAATAMLAQANQAPQSVLQLLR
jgi:flagellin